MAAKGVTVPSSSVTSLGRAVAGPGQPNPRERLEIGGPPPFLLGHTLPHAHCQGGAAPYREKTSVQRVSCNICWVCFAVDK